jgi:hypothetical protein
VLVLFLSLLGCETEQDRARDAVATLAGELPLIPGETPAERKRRVESNLAPWIDPEFELVAPWLGGGNDRAFAIVAASEIERMFPLRSLDVGDPEVQLPKSERRAHVAGRARLSASQAFDLHGFDVDFKVDLKRDGKLWRVVRIELRDPRQELPEARP